MHTTVPSFRSGRSFFPQILLTLVCASGFGVAPASASTLKVPSAAHPTFAAAIAAAQAGDVVEIQPGTYSEPLVVAARTQLLVRGKGKVVIDGGGVSQGVSVTDSTHIRLERIEVRNTLSHAFKLIDCSYCSFSRCTAVGAGDDGFWFVGGFYISLSECVARDVQGDGYELGVTSSLIRKSSARSCVGNGIVIHGNGDTLLQCSVTDAVAGIAVFQASKTEGTAVLQCKVRAAKSTGIGLGGFGRGATVRGNSVRDCEGYGIQIEHESSNCTGNSVRNTVFAGIWFAAPDSTVEGNVVRGSQSQGFFVHAGADGSILVNNKVIDAATYGYDLNASPMTLIGSTAKNCGSGPVSVGPLGLAVGFDNGFEIP